MAKIFYDHLIKFEEITQELGKFELDAVEMEEIIRIADETIQVQILEVILTHLPKVKHEEFLIKFHHQPHDEKLLEFLEKEASAEIEELIKSQAKVAKKNILLEISRAKK